jgi:hypothetical protein
MNIHSNFDLRSKLEWSRDFNFLLNCIVSAVASSKSGVPKPTLSFSTENPSEGISNSLKRFEEGLRSSNSKLEVFHMVLTGASWDVWGFNFKQYDDYYWSWKPNVLEKAILAERRLPLFDDQGTTMDAMLQNLRAAPIREVPRGADTPATFSFKNGKKIDREILFALLPHPSTEESVKAAVKDVFKQFENPQIRKAYHLSMQNTVRSTNMISDVQANGPLWDKLKAAADNMVYTKLYSLNEIFLDIKIEEIIRVCFGMTGGESPSMWGSSVAKLAFGVTLNNGST